MVFVRFPHVATRRATRARGPPPDRKPGPRRRCRSESTRHHVGRRRSGPRPPAWWSPGAPCRSPSWRQPGQAVSLIARPRRSALHSSASRLRGRDTTSDPRFDHESQGSYRLPPARWHRLGAGGKLRLRGLLEVVRSSRRRTPPDPLDDGSGHTAWPPGLVASRVRRTGAVLALLLSGGVVAGPRARPRAGVYSTLRGVVARSPGPTAPRYARGSIRRSMELTSKRCSLDRARMASSRDVRRTVTRHL